MPSLLCQAKIYLRASCRFVLQTTTQLSTGSYQLIESKPFSNTLLEQGSRR